MEHTLSFQIKDISSFIEMTKGYFLNNNFKVISESNNSRSFAKGSTWKNMITMNPLNWKSKISIKLENFIVTAIFDIDPIHQIVTNKEIELWDSFIKNYTISIIEKKDMTSENLVKLKETKKSAYNFLMWIVILGILSIIPICIFADKTGLTVFPIGIIIAFGVYLHEKYNGK